MNNRHGIARWRLVALVAVVAIGLGWLYYYKTRMCCAPPPITLPTTP